MRLNDYRKTALSMLAMMAAMALSTSVNAALANYSQNFEALDIASATALGNDGWLVYGNVFNADKTELLYTYGASAAPNNGPGFSNIVDGQGGPAQGVQQLSVFSDYSNLDQAGNWIESIVYQEQAIDATDVGSIWSFTFDVKQGNQMPDSSSLAFIKTLDPGNNNALTNFLTEDTTDLGFDWSTYTLDLLIPADNSLDGQLLQFGFSSTATNYTPSGVLYDNINFSTPSAVPLPGAVWLMLSGLIGLFGVARRRKS